LGRTPLETALYFYGFQRAGDQRGIAEYLLAKGASGEGRALEFAITGELLDIARELVRLGEKPSPDMLATYVNKICSLESINPQVVEFLLENGVEIDMPD
jgi:hypothetical protein